MNLFLIEWLIQLGFAVWSWSMLYFYPQVPWPFFTLAGVVWTIASTKKLIKGIRCIRMCKARNRKKE